MTDAQQAAGSDRPNAPAFGFPRRSRRGGGTAAALGIMKTRKQVYELKPADLIESPVWEFALDEEGEEDQDEATVRPFLVAGPLDPSDGMFIVRASFKLADGTSQSGYLTPGVQGDRGIGTVQPAIVTERGQVSFWCGIIQPAGKHLAECYARLGKKPEEIFPFSFSSQVDLVGGTVSGTIPGFLVLEDFKLGKFKVVQ